MDEKTIGREIVTLSILLKRKIISVCSDNSLGRNGYIISYILSREEDTFQRDIEKKFRLRRSTVTAALNRLEKEGFIVRQKVEGDSRLKKITVTETAKKIHEDFNEKIRELDSEISNLLTDDEINDFYTITGKLKEFLDDKKIG